MYCDYGQYISIGSRSFINFGAMLIDVASFFIAAGLVALVALDGNDGRAVRAVFTYGTTPQRAPLTRFGPDRASNGEVARNRPPGRDGCRQ